MSTIADQLKGMGVGNPDPDRGIPQDRPEGGYAPDKGGALPQPQPEWDYRTSPLSPTGDVLPAGATNWTPTGQPYFGPGFVGTLKRYWWTVSGKPTSGQEGDNWKRMYSLAEQLNDTTSNADAGKFALQNAGEFLRLQGNALTGTEVGGNILKDPKLQDQKTQLDQQIGDLESKWGFNAASQQWNPDTPQEVKTQHDQLLNDRTTLLGTAANVNIAGREGSVIQPLVRLTELGMAVIGDVFQEASVKYEQSAGAAQASAEAATEKGSVLPSLRLEDKNNSWTQGLDNASRLLLPALKSWDSLRLLVAEGTYEEKVGIAKAGFDAGRLLYTQTIQPTVMEEYKRRIASGEDPQLVALSLENPWAEGVGRAIFDPLWAANAVGELSKVGGAVKAVKAETTGTELATEVGKVLENAGSAIGETRAAQTLDVLDDVVVRNTSRLEKTLVTNLNNPLDYSPSGLRLVETKMAMRTSNNLVGAIMTRGNGTYDDVADMFTALAKSVSTDKATRLEGMDAVMDLSNKFHLGRYAYSDDVQKTAIIVRNLADDAVFKELAVAKEYKAGNLLELLNAGKGDPAKMASILQKTFEQAVSHQVPLFQELRKAAKVVEEGAAVTDRTAEMAKQYEKLSATTKGLWTLQEGTVGNFKRWVNGMLSKFYFSTPGFVSRNTMNNFVTMLIDEGPVKTLNAMLWKTSDIDKWAGEYFGGKLPPAFGGFSLIRSEKGGTFISNLNDKVESSFAKRIYWSRFRESMDMFVQPGVSLPSKAEFQAAGLTSQQVDHFVHILRGEAAGNVDKAIIKYAEKYGKEGVLDSWKFWSNSVSPDEMKGLKAFYADKKLDELVSTATSPQEIEQTFDTLIADAKKMASSAADSPIQDVAGVGKAVESGHLSIDDANQLNILEAKFEEAADTMDNALWELNRRYPDLDLSVYRQAFSRQSLGQVRREAKAIIDTAWDFTKKAKNASRSELETLWKSSVLGTKPIPARLNSQRFLDDLWSTSKNLRMAMWDAHFKDQFIQIEQFVTGLNDPQIMGLFKDAQKASAELQLYRNATFTGGKIFAEKPAANIRELAQRYGIATATTEGQKAVGADQHILNAVNKASGQQFKSLDEIPMDVAEQAFKSRAGEATKAAEETQAKIGKYTTPRERGYGTNTYEGFLKYAEQNGLDSAKANKEWLDNGPLVDQWLKDASVHGEAGPYGNVPAPEGLTQIMPPEVKGVPPTPAQMAHANHDGLVGALNKVRDYMLANYGVKAEQLDGTTLGALKKLMVTAGKDGLTPSARVNEAIAMADKIGTHWRDFALLPYGETRNFDLALSYALPYQFWYSRSYANWMQRIGQDSQVIGNYARIKDTMAKMNKESPEWWRYNVTIPSHFLGMPIEHPLSINLEANIWPLYGITGVDFNDPDKRVNWWTSTIDDMGKFGPSIWAPVNIAVATILNAQGDQDAASRWAGRLIPQSATVKAITSILNPQGQPLELDPLVQTFAGKGFGDTAAMDPYERNRVGRMLAQMAQQDPTNEKAYLEAARTQSGPLWDQAIREATHMRAWGQVSSFALGAGFKARTPEDQQIDQFYQDYHKLTSMMDAGLVSPDKSRQAWDQLREQYPFMDTLLLSRKAGLDRDRAYAFNVLSRIPPGQATDLFKIVGVDPTMADKFYSNGGKLEFMSESEQQKFKSAMLDLGAMLEIPEYATKTDWNNARDAYKNMQIQLQGQFGEDILTKIDDYYNMDANQAREYRAMHPEVTAAQQYQNQMVVNNPMLFEYYGGIKTLENYQKGKMYDALYAKYGKDIQIYADTYNQLKDQLDNAGARDFLRLHPELTKYWKDKAKMQDETLRVVARLANYLPEGEPVSTGGEPQNATQTAIQEYSQQKPTVPWSDWQTALGTSMTNLVRDYYVNGKELPKAAQTALDYQAYQYGYETGDQLLEALGISLYVGATP